MSHEVEVSYRNQLIGALDVTGSATLKTNDKLCDSDIEVVYNRPEGSGALNPNLVTIINDTGVDVTIRSVNPMISADSTLTVREGLSLYSVPSDASFNGAYDVVFPVREACSFYTFSMNLNADWAPDSVNLNAEPIRKGSFILYFFTPAQVAGQVRVISGGLENDAVEVESAANVGTGISYVRQSADGPIDGLQLEISLTLTSQEINPV